MSRKEIALFLEKPPSFNQLDSFYCTTELGGTINFMWYN
jgi:hypothetical protein